jgi:hypothetical protein
MTRTGHIIGTIVLAGGAFCADNGKPAPARRTEESVVQKPAPPRANLTPLRPKRANDNQGQAKGESPLLRNLPTPITTLDRWNRMTPDQRSRALAKLTPERRQQIQERLDRFNAMPKEEQDRMRRRYDRFSHLAPERQAIVKRQIQAFIKLPDERRPAISREFEQLRRLPADERNARMNSEEFRNRYSPREQQLLSDLSNAMPITAAGNLQKK